MFDAISVSNPARSPWTLAVSFTAQTVLIGLAILIPLVSTEALPHANLVSFLLPAAAPPARRDPPPAKPLKQSPRVVSVDALIAPSKIPTNIALIEETPPEASAIGSGPGVVGGTGDPSQLGNVTITGIVGSLPVPPVHQPAAVKPPEAIAPVTRITVGGRVQEGKLISGPRPTYPALARSARVSGDVRLQAVISRAGAIMDLMLISGHPLLVGAAMAAVKQWIFRPTMLNGEPVEVATDITVHFALQ